MLSRTVAVLAAVALMAGLVASQDTLDDLYLSLYNLTENKNTVTEPPAPPPAPAAAAAPAAAPAPAPAPAQPRYVSSWDVEVASSDG